MARPANTDLRNSIKARYAELKTFYPLGADLVAMLTKEFGLSDRSIRHYLRSNDSDDSRSRYTDDERAYLLTCTRTEIFAWAKTHNRRPESVYAMVLRRREAAGPSEPVNVRISKIQARQYLDFSNPADLAAYNLTQTQFTKAQEFLANLKQLTLRAPNFLEHPPTGRFYILALAEQLAVVKNPAGFLRDRGPHIKESWQGGVGMEVHLLWKGQVLGAFSSHIEATKAVRWFARNLPDMSVTTKTAPIGSYTPGQPTDEEFEALMTKLETAEAPEPPHRAVDPEALASTAALLETLVPDRPAPAEPPKPKNDVPALSPAPAAYRDITGAPLHPKWSFRKGSAKGLVTLNSPDVDTAAAYYSGLDVDDLPELLASIPAEDWLIVYDARGDIVDRTDNAPELGIGE